MDGAFRNGLLALTLSLSAVSCSLDSFRSSALPETKPDDVIMRFSEHGGMAPAWKRLEIKNDELVVEDKQINLNLPTIKYCTVSSDEQAELFKVFRENKFDLIKNYETKDITYDAGSDSLSLQIGNESYRASSGDNFPFLNSGASRYREIAQAFNALATSRMQDLILFPQNAAIINYNPRIHRLVENDAQSTVLSYGNAARAIAIAREGLKKFGRLDAAPFEDYNLQLVPFTKDKQLTVYVNGFCGPRPNRFRTKLDQPESPSNCRFTLFANPHDGTYRKLTLNNDSQMRSSQEPK